MRDEAKAPIDTPDPFRVENFLFKHVCCPFYDFNHSRDGGSAPPEARETHKSNTEQSHPHLKDDFLLPLWASYTMPAALLKMDHPCFFDSNRVGDGFRPRGGSFYLFRFADTFAGLHDDFFVGQTIDIHRNSKPGPENNTGRRKTRHHTIGIGSEVITKRTCLRSCKQPEDAVERRVSVGLPAVCGCSFLKARSWPFGLFLSMSLSTKWNQKN